MKQRWIFAAVSVLAFCAPASAADPLRLAQAAEAGILPPHEIITIVRSTRLDPVGRPVLRGPNYVVHAIDETDREMRVIVNARRGEILRIVPVQTASRMPPPGGGYTAGPYERERYERAAPAPRYIAPGARYGARPPVIDDDDDDDLPYEQAPRPPGNVSGAAPPRTGYADPPPVIRATPPASGPGVARGTELPPPSSGALPPPSGPRAATAAPPPRGAAPSQSASRDVYSPEPDREGGMLPPPPERFPQRVAPAPEKHKPVKREATAAAPKAAPLPKPKPAVPASATAPKPAAPAPSEPAAAPATELKTEAPKPSPAPEQKPAVEQKPADDGVPH